MEMFWGIIIVAIAFQLGKWSIALIKCGWGFLNGKYVWDPVSRKYIEK